MIKIKEINEIEKEALEARKFVKKVAHNQQAPTILYDVILHSHIQLITQKDGIILFNFDELQSCYYFDEKMFVEVIII